ncbi:MAG: hypothetical protein LBP59_00160 [Planctomycetaceae bacterium]|nr:hypothetical protein [Planctomycetaceae bacterium]
MSTTACRRDAYDPEMQARRPRSVNLSHLDHKKSLLIFLICGSTFFPQIRKIKKIIFVLMK